MQQRMKTIDAAAMDFVRMLLGPNPSAAYDLMSKTGQAETTREKLDAAAEAIIRKFEPKNVTLQHTYFIEWKGKSPTLVHCGTVRFGQIVWKSVTTESTPEQAHVLLSADARKEKLAFVVWLVPEQNDWKVRNFRLNNVSTLAGKDSIQLWQLARAQQARGHTFNASELYGAALATASRGPNINLGLSESIVNDGAKLIPPADIQGQPPYLWRNAETTYKMMGVGLIAIDGKIYVRMVHEVPPWQSDRQVGAWNKEMLSYFKRHFPECSDAFAGLVAVATERGSKREYSTVEELTAAK